MTSERTSREALARADAAWEQAGAARHAAEQALLRSDEILRRLDESKMTQMAIIATQIDVRKDLQRIEATGLRVQAQAEKTNGRVTLIELWRSELKGIAQGAGGTGRLLFYMLSSAAAAGTIVVAAIAVLAHVVIK